jgi:hypothetical protein
MSFTNRANQILTSRKHFLTENDNSKSHLFKLSGDKKLTVKHVGTGDHLKDLVFETISILTNEREPNSIMKITFKEFESFLRDDNSIPSFNSDNRQLAENYFLEGKNLFIFSWLVTLKKANHDHRNLNFIDKMRVVSEFIELVSLNITTENVIKLEYVEHEFIYYSLKSPEEYQFLVLGLENFFSELFSESIKLVAVR